MKWEYNIVSIYGPEGILVSYLDKMGSEGWDLISVCEGIAYLKRPLDGYKSYTYETCQDGYVIYDKSGREVKPYDLIKMLQ